MNSKKKNIRVFIDFDGTITEKDVCNEIFKKFGKFDKYINRLFDGEIDMVEFWNLEIADLNENLTENELLEFIAGFQPAPYFAELVEFLQSENIPITIISDGFDLYIKNILAAAGFENIGPVFSNKLIYENGKFRAEYPYSSENCPCPAAMCKRNAIIRSSSEFDIIVFIGDGFSDRCAVQHSDINFAKGALAAYCNEKRIPHYPYKSFFDVTLKLKECINNNKIKQRNEAYINRKNAVEAE
ncbi:MAG: MtnX-like HAD-IB family phosphatase [bacterium]